MNLYLIKRDHYDCYYDQTYGVVVASPTREEALAHIRKELAEEYGYDIDAQWSSDNKRLTITFLGMYAPEAEPGIEPVLILTDHRAG